MSLSEFSLKGKKALVIGARRNMGKGFALGLAEAGAAAYGFQRETPASTSYKADAALCAATARRAAEPAGRVATLCRATTDARDRRAVPAGRGGGRGG